MSGPVPLPDLTLNMKGGDAGDLFGGNFGNVNLSSNDDGFSFTQLAVVGGSIFLGFIAYKGVKKWVG